MQDKVRVLYEDLFNAEVHWDDFWGANNTKSFDQFIGWDRVDTVGWDIEGGERTLILPPNVAHKIAMLNGPHWYTILRAYQAIQSEQMK